MRTEFEHCQTLTGASKQRIAISAANLNRTPADVDRDGDYVKKPSQLFDSTLCSLLFTDVFYEDMSTQPALLVDAFGSPERQ
ncbi:MAG: hypothetical protein ACRYG8_15470 [Janthinobacterium lividum]